MSRQSALNDKKVVDTLRLSADEVEEILLILDAAKQEIVSSNRRLNRRFAYRRLPGLIINIDNPGGSPMRYKVIPRDISSNGMGMLIGTYVYTGRSCSITLMPIGGGLQAVPGQIVRCEHIRGRLHEIGIKFDAEIDLTGLIGGRAIREPQHDACFSPPTLTGALLYVEECVDDRELMRFLTSRMGLRITVTDDIDEAVDLVSHIAFDGVIVRLDLNGATNTAPCAALRAAGFQRFMLGISTDDRGPLLDDALTNGCDRALIKPFSFNGLIDILCEFLPQSDAAPAEDDLRPLQSAQWPNIPMRPLILGFLRRLEKKVERVRAQTDQRQEMMEIVKTLQELKGSAAGYGYAVISEAAAELMLATTAQEPWDDLANQISDLDRLCKRACQVHRQAINGNRTAPA